MTFNEIKQILVSKYNFIDNSYLDDYIQLMTTADLSSDGYREYHHLIPVVFYKEKYHCEDRSSAEKLANKDTNNRLVHLLYKDHCKAHYDLYCCTSGAIKYQNAAAYLCMIQASRRHIKNDLPVLTELDYIELQLVVDNIRNDPNSKYFSDSEIKFLIDNVKDLGTTKCAEILKRPRSVVSKLSVSLGLTESSGPRVDWSDTEKLWLKSNSKKYSRQECAKILGKTEAGVHAMEQRLKISGSRISNIKWTAEDDAWLLANYKKVDRQVLAVKLNRTENAIKARLRTLGETNIILLGKSTSFKSNKHRKTWTTEEQSWLKTNYKCFTIKECAEYLNRSESAVEHAILRFGLHK